VIAIKGMARSAVFGPGLALASALLVALDAGAQSSTQHDTSLPIEITSDSLEVEQKERVATFEGNVDAVQGDLVLSADKLKVHYNQGDEEAEALATGSIRKIEAVGNVFLSSPRETAQGDVGVYDVVANSVTLEGSVVLTQDENVIRGQRLEIDLTTGHSRVVAAVTSDDGGTAPDRVRAIFVPADAATPGAGPPSDDAAEGEPQATGVPRPLVKPDATN